MIPRTLAQHIETISKSFSVLLITGPRQIGKTTLLSACADGKRQYVTLDDFALRELACTDPALFMQRYPPPILIDEIQYAPNLFSAIKIEVDRRKTPGLFWLTGSQKFQLMKNVTETLAGRVAILDLLGFSQAEIEKRPSVPFLPTQTWIETARSQPKSPKKIMDIYTHIWRGSYPQIVLDQNMPRDLFYQSYIQTYIQRDVKDILSIQDDMAFTRFLRAIAARTGQLLNYSDMARDIDINHKTMKAWLSILETSGLIYLLHPYHNNLSKRLIKTPKLYFLDTGLCSYLTQWPSPEALEAGNMSGAILETYIFTEILKSYWHNARTPYLHYYRDTDQKEIDLLIEEGDTLYPIEFKKTTNPGKSTYQSFRCIETLNKKRGHGAVICLREEDIPLSPEVDAIPVSDL